MARVVIDAKPEILTSARFGDIRRGFDPKSTILASIIAGLIYLASLIILMPIVYSDSVWTPFRMIGAVILGQGALTPQGTFDPLVTAAAIVVVLAASVIYGYLGMAVLRPYHPLTALVGGAAFGLLLYLFNFYVLSAIFPWFADFRGWVVLLGHLIFGVVLGAAYLSIKRWREGYRGFRLA